MKKIGIFGCSADPFTLAHREIVKEVLEQKLVDEVVIVPTIVSYYRGDKLPWLSDAEKLNIIKALTLDLHPVHLDKTELDRRYLCLGTELELSNNFVFNKNGRNDKFYAVPTLAAKWTF